MQRPFFTYSLIGFSALNKNVIKKTLLSNPVGIDSEKVELEDLPTVVFFDMDSTDGQRAYQRLAQRIGSSRVFVSIALDHANFAGPYKLNKMAYPSKLTAFLHHFLGNYRHLLVERPLYSNAELSTKIASLDFEDFNMDDNVIANIQPDLIMGSSVQTINADDVRKAGGTSKLISSLHDQFN